jgi:uncharacterized repeat protein (TIGR03803 family)
MASPRGSTNFHGEVTLRAEPPLSGCRVTAKRGKVKLLELLKTSRIENLCLIFMKIPGIAQVFHRANKLLILETSSFPRGKAGSLPEGSISRSWLGVSGIRLPILFCMLSLRLASQVTAQPFTTLHNLAAGSTNVSGVYTNADGTHPFAGLVLSGTTLYGAAQDGGNWGKGTVFAVNTDGTAFTTLHSFTPTSGNSNVNSDGAIPQGTLIVASNTLYGTTIAGGSGGVGAVFAVNIDGNGFVTLHSFTGLLATGEGAYPYAGLILSGDTLFGTTSEGGSAGNGTVFAINTNGTGFRTVYSFAASRTNTSGLYTNSDGASPSAGLIMNGNTLYGTTSAGGSAGKGTVFAIRTDGTGFINLHDFTGVSDGAYPYARLVLSGNNLYGTTEFGGTADNGTVFAININGTGFIALHNFTGSNDGARPTSALVLSGNTLYGTAQFGGPGGNGTIFGVNTNGTSFNTLYSFNGGGDGSLPYAGLVLLNDTLYGTATGGGSSGLGTVFSLSPGGTVNRPTLTIIPAETNVVLLWPTNAAGFILQSTTNLVSPAIWTPVLGVPGVVNGQNALTNPVSGAHQFFRLIQ